MQKVPTMCDASIWSPECISAYSFVITAIALLVTTVSVLVAVILGFAIGRDNRKRSENEQRIETEQRAYHLLEVAAGGPASFLVFGEGREGPLLNYQVASIEMLGNHPEVLPAMYSLRERYIAEVENVGENWPLLLEAMDKAISKAEKIKT
jgi:hypothetical protein